METRIEQINQCEKEIFFSLDKTELEPHFEKAYSEAQKNIKMSGFRPGKVPKEMIRKQFGKSIELEATDAIMNEAFNNYLQENKIGFYGKPTVKEFDLKDEYFKFSIVIEVTPDIQLTEYKDLVIDEPVHKVTDEEVEDNIEKILEREAKTETAQSVTDYYHVVGLNIYSLDENGNRLEAVEPIKNFVYLNDKQVFPEIKQSLLNAKGGDFVKVDLSKENKKYEFEVLEIQKMILPELNDEFVSRVTNDKFNNVDDFREDVGFQLQEEWDRLSKQQLENNLIQKLLDTQPQFDIPKALIATIGDNIYQEELKRLKLDDTDQNRKKIYTPQLIESAEKSARWQIILDNIIKNENIEIEEHDIEEEIEKLHSLYNIDKQIIRERIVNSNFINTLLVRKAMDLLLDFTSTNEVQFANSYDDFEQELDEEYDGSDDPDEFSDDYDEEEEGYEPDFDEFDEDDDEEEDEEDDK